jgi:hypothetical protein
MVEKISWNEELIADWRQKAASEAAGDGPGPTIPVGSALPKCLANTIRAGIRMGLSMPVLSSLEKLVLFGEKTAEERLVLDIPPRHIKTLLEAGLVAEGPMRRCAKLDKEGRPTIRAEPCQILDDGKKMFSFVTLTRREAKRFLQALSNRKKMLLGTDTPNEGGAKMSLVCRWIAMSVAGRDTPWKQLPIPNDLKGCVEEIREYYGKEEVPPEVTHVLVWLKVRSEVQEPPGRRIVFWPEDAPMEKK